MPTSISYWLDRKIPKKKQNKTKTENCRIVPCGNCQKKKSLEGHEWIEGSYHFIELWKVLSWWKRGAHFPASEGVVPGKKRRRKTIAAEKLHFEWWLFYFIDGFCNQAHLQFKLESSRSYELFKIEWNVSTKFTRCLDNNSIGLLVSQTVPYHVENQRWWHNCRRTLNCVSFFYISTWLIFLDSHTWSVFDGLILRSKNKIVLLFTRVRVIHVHQINCYIQNRRK